MDIPRFLCHRLESSFRPGYKEYAEEACPVPPFWYQPDYDKAT
jgi:hypothetical protein